MREITQELLLPTDDILRHEPPCTVAFAFALLEVKVRTFLREEILMTSGQNHATLSRKVLGIELHSIAAYCLTSPAKFISFICMRHGTELHLWPACNRRNFSAKQATSSRLRASTSMKFGSTISWRAFDTILTNLPTGGMHSRPNLLMAILQRR